MSNKKLNKENHKFILNKANTKYLIIPCYIILDVRLTPLDHRVFGLINSLSSGQSSCCIMSNNRIAEHINTTRSSVSKSITKLCRLGFIRREIIFEHQNRFPVGRKLWPNDEVECVFPKNISNEMITIKRSKAAICGIKDARGLESSDTPNILNNKNTSYNIFELEKIDTLDFIK